MNSEKEKLKSALSHYQQAKQDEAERIKQAKQEEAERIEYKRQEVLRRRENFIEGIFRTLGVIFGTLVTVLLFALIAAIILYVGSSVWNFIVACYNWDWEAAAAAYDKCEELLRVSLERIMSWPDVFSGFFGMDKIIACILCFFLLGLIPCIAVAIMLVLMTGIVATIAGLVVSIVNFFLGILSWIAGLFF